MDKKGSGLYPCIDYQRLNHISVKYPYALMLVPSTLEHLRSTHIFRKLDLCSAYNLERISAGDEWKMAFRNMSGHDKYTVMPYGLYYVHPVFRCLINDVLRSMLGKFVIDHNDNILILFPIARIPCSLCQKGSGPSLGKPAQYPWGEVSSMFLPCLS